jgi:hypothetical protein
MLAGMWVHDLAWPAASRLKSQRQGFLTTDR